MLAAGRNAARADAVGVGAIAPGVREADAVGVDAINRVPTRASVWGSWSEREGRRKMGDWNVRGA